MLRKKLLRQVDGWLLARPESAELHLAAGRLAMQDKDLERAQKGFEQAIKIVYIVREFQVQMVDHQRLHQKLKSLKRKK